MTTKSALTTRQHQRSTTVDAIAYLKSDHREVERLFKAFEKAGDKAVRTKRKLVDEIIAALSQHAAIEEQFLYPTARREVPAATDQVLESLEEHHVAKWLLSELLDMDPSDERFVAKTTVLMENVRHHVKEEENDLFPQLRQKLAKKELIELGDKLREAKKLAPQRPHPRSPDEPPNNLIVGVVAGAVDRARAKVKSKL
jgi:hemerythrin-like domain-containing protein